MRNPTCLFLLAKAYLLTGLLTALHADETTAAGLCYAAGTDETAAVIIPLESTEVTLDVKPGLMEAEVIQTFTNPTLNALEATYLYPLPSEATLTSFELRFRDRVITSVVREKKKAREVYEAAKDEGRKAALIEQADPSLFSTAVANFLPGETVKVVIRFVQPLPLTATGVDVRFPMVTGAKYFPAHATPGAAGNAAPNPERLSHEAMAVGHVYAFDIQVAGLPVQAITSSSHRIRVEPQTDGRQFVSLDQEVTIPDRDFVLRIDTEPDRTQLQPTLVTQRTGTGEYALLTLFPPRSRTISEHVVLPRDILFLLDRSGSMEGTRLASAKRGLETCLEALLPDDRFQIVTFDDQFEFYQPTWTSVTRTAIREASRFVRQVHSRGGTVMQPALEASLGFFGPDDRQQLLIFLTDGDVGNPDSLMNLVERRIGRVRLFTLGIGSAPNAFLVRKMAELGRGQARFIDDDRSIARELSDLFTTLDAPVLSDLALELLDAQGTSLEFMAFPERLGDVFLGRPLQAALRTRGVTPAIVRLTGQEDGRPISYDLPVAATPLRGDGLEKQFGRTWYDQLAAARRNAQTDEGRSAWDQHMLTVALEFQLVTDLTSRVAVDRKVSRAPDAPLDSTRVGQYQPADQSNASGEEVIVLSPFEVTTEEDEGYTAATTLAGSRLQTELRDVGAAVSVITKQFLQDIGATNSNTLLTYTTNTEVGAVQGNFAGASDGVGSRPDDPAHPAKAGARVRGLTPADTTRDYFATDIPWDAYNVDRLDLQRGPNSILFGNGSPAGLVNANIDGASFTARHELEARYGRFGSHRLSAETNYVLREDELAVRLAWLRDEAKFQQRPAFRNDHRHFGALRWEPEFLARSEARTSVHMKVEDGSIRSNLPRATPPVDAITPWFENLNRMTFDAATVRTADPTSWANQADAGALQPGSPNFQPWVGTPGAGPRDAVILALDETSSSSFVTQSTAWPDRTGANPVAGRTAVSLRGFDTYAASAGMPGANVGAYQPRSLTDPSIFDFRRQLIDGPNKREWMDFRALNVALHQTFGRDRYGIQLSHDRQDTAWGRETLFAETGPLLTVDVMRTLPDGSANSNVGRPLVVGGGGDAGGRAIQRSRDVWRATAFVDLDFTQLGGAPVWSQLLGRHVFTGLWDEADIRTSGRSWSRYVLSESFGPNADQPVGTASRDVIVHHYLGTALTEHDSAMSAHLPGSAERVVPRGTTIRTYDNVTAAWRELVLPLWNAGGPGSTPDVYRDGSEQRSQSRAQALVWQSHLLEGAVSTVVGWRRDTEHLFDAGAPARQHGIADLADAQWRLPANAADLADGQRRYHVESGSTVSWSVVGHLPATWTERAGGLQVSVFANASENFLPDAHRTNGWGEALASPRGETRDLGVSLTDASGRLSLKLNWFETRETGATLDSAWFDPAAAGALEARAQQAAVATRDGTGLFATSFGTTDSGDTLRWEPAAGRGQSDAASIEAQYATQAAALTDWFAHPLDSGMQQAWGLSSYATGGGDWRRSDVAVIGDTRSDGVEIELQFMPVRGFNLLFNAARTQTVRSGFDEGYAAWVTQRWSELQGPAGDLRLWGPENDALLEATGGTMRSAFRRDVLAPYELLVALQDTDAPEQRRWRWNLVANHAFREGYLKGINLGVGWRWQDRAITGFPLLAGTNGSEPTWDVTRPYRGPIESHLDAWLGYERRLGDNMRWRIQLNVRNLGAGQALVPLTVQPDGSAGVFRIPEPSTWTLTNTLTF